MLSSLLEYPLAGMKKVEVKKDAEKDDDVVASTPNNGAYDMDKFKEDQELEIQTQINHIEGEIEKEIALTVKCEHAKIMRVKIKAPQTKHEREEVVLVNGRGLNITAEVGSLLFAA